MAELKSNASANGAEELPSRTFQGSDPWTTAPSWRSPGSTRACSGLKTLLASRVGQVEVCSYASEQVRHRYGLPQG